MAVRLDSGQKEMPGTLRFIHVGTGGFGGHWCRDVLPRLVAMGKAERAAAGINPTLPRSSLVLGDATR